MAAVKLQNRERLVGVRHLVLAQVGDQPRPVKLFLVAHLAVFGKRLIYVFGFLRSLSRRMEIRTSVSRNRSRCLKI